MEPKLQVARELATHGFESDTESVVRELQRLHVPEELWAEALRGLCTPGALTKTGKPYTKEEHAHKTCVCPASKSAGSRREVIVILGSIDTKIGSVTILETRFQGEGRPEKGGCRQLPLPLPLLWLGHRRRPRGQALASSKLLQTLPSLLCCCGLPTVLPVCLHGYYYLLYK